MSTKRYLSVLCMIFLLLFAYGCNKEATESEGTEAATNTQEEAGEHTHEGEEAADHTHEGKEPGEHTPESGETAEHTHEGEEAGEHTHEGETEPHTHEGEEAGEHTHGEEGEEAGPQMGVDSTYDEVRNGVRLVLSFDSESSAFFGTVENVTGKTISRVRVEVHLSNGAELGPTEPVDLAPGKKIEVMLSAEGQSFIWWIAHAEAGSSEH